jgi:hypothetical protein
MNITRRMVLCFWTLVVAVVGLDVQAARAAVITSFDPLVVFSGTSPQQQAALNAAVGITGFAIEPFEAPADADYPLIHGLAVGFWGLDPITVFGTRYHEIQWHLDTTFEWDEMMAFAPGFAYPPENLFGDTVFVLSPGATSFGIGISDVETDVRLLVNGVDFGLLRSLPNYHRVQDDAREVYIRIDALPGEPPLREIRFRSEGDPSNQIGFDHLAVQLVPEPSTLALTLCSVLSGLVFKYRRRRL